MKTTKIKQLILNILALLNSYFPNLKIANTIWLKNISWENFQYLLEKQHKRTSNLTKPLETLYNQQIQTNFIRKDILKNIDNTYIIYNQEQKPILIIQYNPARLKRGQSSIPNPNPKHILPNLNVPCFCCLDNIKIQWPYERGYELKIKNQKFVFCPNPFPFLKHHFILMSLKHRPQIMNIELCLKTSQLLPMYWVAQNGPDAGASNPWHFHLQIAKADLPINNYQSHLLKKVTISTRQTIQIQKIDLPLDIYKISVKKITPKLIKYLQNIQQEFLSLNSNNRLTYIIKNYDNQLFDIYISLRSAQRKSKLYTGTPAFVENLGLIITTSEKEFQIWKKQGLSRYKKLLKDIKIDSPISKKFEDLL